MFPAWKKARPYFFHKYGTHHSVQLIDFSFEYIETKYSIWARKVYLCLSCVLTGEFELVSD